MFYHCLHCGEVDQVLALLTTARLLTGLGGEVLSKTLFFCVSFLFLHPRLPFFIAGDAALVGRDVVPVVHQFVLDVFE